MAEIKFQATKSSVDLIIESGTIETPSSGPPSEAINDSRQRILTIFGGQAVDDIISHFPFDSLLRSSNPSVLTLPLAVSFGEVVFQRVTVRSIAGRVNHLEALTEGGHELANRLTATLERELGVSPGPSKLYSKFLRLVSPFAPVIGTFHVGNLTVVIKRVKHENLVVLGGSWS